MYDSGTGTSQNNKFQQIILKVAIFFSQFCSIIFLRITTIGKIVTKIVCASLASLVKKREREIKYNKNRPLCYNTVRKKILYRNLIFPFFSVSWIYI